MKLSVALCTFNGERYLAAQLESLCLQLRWPDELIVCDDASTDATPALLERFAATAPFPVLLHRNPANLGSTRNFDQAIGHCTGDIIFLCDQDDVWVREKMARFEACFAEADVGLVASDLELVDESGQAMGRRMWAHLPFTPAMRQAVERGNGYRHWARYNTITGAATAFRSSLRDLIRPIPASWNHDAWIALLASVVSEARLIDEPMVRYRLHAGQQIGARRRTLLHDYRSARNRGAGYFADVAEAYEAAVERLASARPLRREGVAGWLQRKAAFARVQARMRQGPRVGRLAPSIRELACGNYHRFSRGWKGFAADLFA